MSNPKFGTVSISPKQLLDDDGNPFYPKLTLTQRCAKGLRFQIEQHLLSQLENLFVWENELTWIDRSFIGSQYGRDGNVLSHYTDKADFDKESNITYIEISYKSYVQVLCFLWKTPPKDVGVTIDNVYLSMIECDKIGYKQNR